MAKLEIVKQRDIQDCGACVLYAIIKYYHGYVPLEKIREDLCITKFGTTAYHIVMAARNYGFDAMGVKVDDIHDSNIYFPAIAHVILNNGLNHFVVIYKVTKNDVWLMDPSRGKVRIKIKDFLAIWDHTLILLTPITQIIKFNQPVMISSVFFKLILSNKTIFIKVCLINLILMILTIISSFYFQIAVSVIEKGYELSFFVIICLFFLLFKLWKIFLTFSKNYYLAYFYKNIDVVLFSDFLAHIFNLPLKFMQNRHTGEVVSRVSDLAEVKEFFAEFFTNILLNLVLVIGSLIALFTISHDLFFILCFVVIGYLFIGIITSKLIYKNIQKNIQSTTEFNSILIENVELNTSIWNLNLKEPFFKRLENKLILMLKNSFKTEHIFNSCSIFREFVYEIGLFLVMTCGIYFIYLEKLDLLSFITFNTLIVYLFSPIQDFFNLLPKYNYLKATFKKITEFMCLEAENSNDGFLEIPDGTVEFIDVGFSYNKIHNVLEHVNFKIASGEKALLVGPSGCGKSTICHLICYPFDICGKIKLGHGDMADYSLNTIRRTILYVGQNEKLFTGTILENITCFRKVLDNELLKVMEICCLDDIVKKRPNRYQTLINASINNLSGGEKQRIILARALLKKAKILILDEALSEVDLKLEKKIISAIQRAFKNETLIYVSHKNVQSEFTKIINMEDLNA